ncbi:3-hydroxyacyl-CoA dehydrogenase [Marinivivus vitaminiproducens]|uniref:3-hydroxyacyl-CoA dehydrogenase n=1 Tax=Marinivivus vitaminiproducens TaxID=3035935 RepID=UPI0027A03499|nr:3-hydroxyacyl-CoA dehydrogenase [Geminicoccaceae bacterium SCSIO 64248]
MSEKPDVAIVGTGLVGRAWAITFARGGSRVRLYDATEGAAEKALGFIESVAADLAENELLAGQSPSDLLARITPARDLADVLDGAAYVQESAPEKVEVKRALFAELDAAAAPETILASSSSAIRPSLFTEDLKGRARCLVVHPINPPYLIPAAEVVPAPWTAPETVERARALMLAIGQEPLVMKRELDGFIMNRMQGALLEEAFRLVASGACTAEDVDIGIRSGLALRWSFMGPFETIDLNAPAGIREYVERYQGMYRDMHPDMCVRVDWEGPVLDGIEADRRERLPTDELATRSLWRDRRLMALLRHKRAANDTIGS